MRFGICIEATRLDHICQGIYNNPQMPKRNKPFALDLLFRALADRTRLRLLNLIADKEICVCYFVEILGISQPKISRHLAYLRRAGIAAARRQGRWMHYRLVIPQDAISSSILKETLKHLRERPDMRRDYARLDSACCKPRDFELPKKVPMPSLVSISTK
jgi:ArsR family transcriptional regulator, arsenate/arsenite/antimonite-responsive transcriptional repressor